MSCLFYRAAGRSREERAEGKYKSRAIECVDYPPPISLVRFTRNKWGGVRAVGGRMRHQISQMGWVSGGVFGGCAIFKHPIPPLPGGMCLPWPAVETFPTVGKAPPGCSFFLCVQMVAERKLMGGLPILRMQP